MKPGDWIAKTPKMAVKTDHKFKSEIFRLSMDVQIRFEFLFIVWLIVYTYKLVMRAIASLWFPEMWTMTRREAEGHRSRRGKPNHFSYIDMFRDIYSVCIFELLFLTLHVFFNKQYVQCCWDFSSKCIPKKSQNKKFLKR